MQFGFLTKIGGLAMSHIDFVKKAFSDAGQPSSSRLLTIPQSLVAWFCAVYATVVTHGHPDATVIVALGGLSTAHYVVNRVSNMIQKKDQPTEDKNGDK